MADLGGGGVALGASAPPARSMVKKYLKLPFFFSMYGRYLFACSVSPILKSATAVNCHT